LLGTYIAIYLDVGDSNIMKKAFYTKSVPSFLLLTIIGLTALTITSIAGPAAKPSHLSTKTAEIRTLIAATPTQELPSVRSTLRTLENRQYAVLELIRSGASDQQITSAFTDVKISKMEIDGLRHELSKGGTWNAIKASLLGKHSQARMTQFVSELETLNSKAIPASARRNFMGKPWVPVAVATLAGVATLTHYLTSYINSDQAKVVRTNDQNSTEESVGPVSTVQ
jgi:hypothetical protein